MSWLFRPSILILLSVVLVLGAAVLVLWQRNPDPGPAALDDEEQEIVWLYSATSAATWERFVTAVNAAAERLRVDYPDLEVQIGERAFPAQTTAVPELALVLRSGSARLVFRWYKLTSDQKTESWVERLVRGPRRPPLAIIGGASSDSAIELARSLTRAAAAHPDATPPLLLLTTATADQAERSDGTADSAGPYVPLTRLYVGRTFRFCFTNRQMAEAVTRFIWDEPELRPDVDPVYLVVWWDDAYSRDLIGHFADSLRQPARTLTPREWAGLAVGHAAAGAPPLGLAALCTSPLLWETPFFTEWIDYSIGTFDQPNRWEAPVVARLMDVKLQQYPRQQRPLLVLPAAAQGPARRFLRGLVRASPAEARRFVVATGDGLAFNTVYRDRNVSWPIQDLPLDLVFFCHRNPVDEQAGFRPEGNAARAVPGRGAPATGTEDLLLFMDIIQTLVHASCQGKQPPRTGDELREHLAQMRWKEGVRLDLDGRPLFDADGNRQTGTGEHIVWLHPCVQGRQVLPLAAVRIWSRPANGGRWRLAADLKADYEVGAAGAP